MMAEWGVGTEPAKKTEKRAYQEWMRGLIMSGSIQVHYSECSELIDETRRLPFDPETGKESDRYRKHNADSALYLTRAMLPRYKPEQELPAPGTPERINHDMNQDLQKKLKWLQKQRNRRGA